MRNNVSNWGLNFIFCPSKSGAEMINIYGCNQDVRRFNTPFTRIITAIPLEDIEEWMKEVEGFTMERYISIINAAGFPCRLATEEEIKQIPNKKIIPRSGGDHINLNKSQFCFVTQDIDYNTVSNKTYYYTFCLLRHIYYCAHTWKVNIVQKVLQGGKDLLSLAASMSGNNQMHSLFYLTGLVNPQLFEFMKKGLGNSNFTMQKAFIVKDRKYFLDTKVESPYYIYTVKKGVSVITYLHELTEAATNDKNVKFIQPDFPSGTAQAGGVVHVYEKTNANNIGTILVDNLLERSVAPIPVKIQVFSRHPSQDVFRDMTFDNKSVLLRLGSLTKAKRKYNLEINTEEAIMNSSNKYLMKKCFNAGNVPTAIWFTNYDRTDDTVFDETTKSTVSLNDLPYPIISKPVGGSRAKGVLLHQNAASLRKWANHRFRNLENYIFEKYYNFSKEYRVHATKNEAFLVWRKMQDPTTPEEQKHIRNNSNCTWVGDDNPNFDTPINYKEMLNAAILAVRAVGLDIGGCDIRIQSNNLTYTKKDGTKGSKARERCEIVVIEVNSACSQAERTAIAYKDIINKIVDRSK